MNPVSPLTDDADSQALPWLAFLYVSEEMSPDETADFEERLLTDQSAREAVAQAMAIAEGLWMASAMKSLSPEPSLATPGKSVEPIRQRSAFGFWITSTAVAAGLAFCIGWWFANLSGNFQSPNANLAQTTNEKSDQIAEKHQDTLIPTPEAAEQLVELWTESESLVAGLAVGPSVEVSADSAEDLPALVSQDSGEDTFAWMLAAVSHEQPAIPQTNPDRVEN